MIGTSTSVMWVMRRSPPKTEKAVTPISSRKNPHIKELPAAISAPVKFWVTATMAEMVLKPWAGMQSKAYMI